MLVVLEGTQIVLKHTGWYKTLSCRSESRPSSFFLDHQKSIKNPCGVSLCKGQYRASTHRQISSLLSTRVKIFSVRTWYNLDMENPQKKNYLITRILSVIGIVISFGVGVISGLYASADAFCELNDSFCLYFPKH